MAPADKTTPEGLTPAQVEILSVIWARGEAGVADVWHELAQRRQLARNTVQTMLTRLHERGWLRAREVGNAFLYSPARKREPVLARLVGGLLDTAFGGSQSGLVAALLKARRLSPEEASRIRALIDQAEGTTKAAKGSS
jgi:BlaI family transcriptional regulator, penicillinase repressor